MSRTEIADVLIIGAGLVGGIAARRFATEGLQVVCLEQGSWPDYGNVRSEELDYEVTADLHWARDPNVRGGEADYPVNDGPSDITPLMWNGVGGGTVIYSGKWHRALPSDFRVRTLDGVADDWPFSYEDLEPFYVDVERQMGISGLAGDPAYPPGEGPPLPPVPIREYGRRVARAHNELGWHWWPGSNAIATKKYRSQMPCRQHGTCMSGCPERAKGSTDITLWGDAVDRGTRLITGARVCRILTKGGRATGVEYIDREGVLRLQEALHVVLAANGVGSPRLLLLSANSEHPEGLANSSGLVGKRLMMHPFAAVAGLFEDEVGSVMGAWGQQIQSFEFYETDTDRGFVRGAKWGLQPTGGPLGLTRSYPWSQANKPTWGSHFHEAILSRFNRAPMWSLVAEDLPDERNRVTLDPDIVDSDCIPAPRIDYSVSENSERMLQFHVAKAAESLEAAGAIETIVGPFVRASGWHLMGTTVAGDDRRSSVVDQWGRTHDVPNLHVFDGSIWPTSSGVNPAATMAAVALRCTEHLISLRGQDQ